MTGVDSTGVTVTRDHAGVIIREATLADLDDLVAMGQQFLASTPYADELANNPAQHRAIGTSLIENPAGALLVADVAGRSVGMLGVVIFDHPLSGERTMGETFWWTDPEHRGSVGVRLLKAAETWAIERGAVLIQMTQPSWADRVGRLYKATGYHPIEVAWVKRVGEKS